MKRLLIAFALGLAVSPVIALAQSGPIPAPVTIQNQITVQAPPANPKVVADSAVQGTQAIVASVIAPTPVLWTNELLGLPDLWRTTPPSLTYNHPLLRSLSDGIRIVSFALIALAIFAMGASHALGGGQPMQWGRLLFAAVLSFGTLVWWQIGIDINNAINADISAPSMPSLVQPNLQIPPDPTTAIGEFFLVIVYAIVALLTLFTLVMRLGLIEILIVLGPLFLLCFATSQSEFFALGYTRVATGLTFSQVLIVIGLKVATIISSLGTGLVGALLGIVVLLLIRSLPGMLVGMTNAGGRGGSVLGRIVQAVVLRRLAH